MADEVEEGLYLEEVNDRVVTGDKSTVDLNRCPVEAVHHVVKELFLNISHTYIEVLFYFMNVYVRRTNFLEVSRFQPQMRFL